MDLRKQTHSGQANASHEEGQPAAAFQRESVEEDFPRQYPTPSAQRKPWINSTVWRMIPGVASRR